jgi:hypothetical protein
MNTKYQSKVTIGEYELIESGIIDLWRQDFEIEIQGLKLIFSFDTEKDEDPTLHMVGKTEGEKILKFDVRNMKNGIGEGFFKPIEIGTIDSRQFFITFSGWTFDINNNIRTVVYNLLIK